MKTYLLAIAIMCTGAVAGWAADNGKPLSASLDASDLGPALPAASMAQQTGRQGVSIDELNNTMNTSDPTGTVSSNLLTSTATGANIVSDNAFGNTSGVATIIQNSGNQNVIQSSFILNLSVK
jgi:hypothetical protein